MPSSAPPLDRSRHALRSTGILAWLTVYLVLLFAIPSRLVLHPLGSAGAPSTIFGLASALLWFLAQLWRAASVAGPRRPIRVALACFLAAVGLSYIAAMTRPIDGDEISQADVALLVVVAWSGALLTAHDGLVSLRDVEVFVRRFAFVGGLMALVGLVQYVTKQPLVDRIAIPGLTAVGDVSAAFRNGQVRISGTATSPIEFGALLSILLPLALHGALHPAGRGVVRRWFPVATISLALALSMSRSAYIGLVLALLVLLVGWPPALRWRIGGSFLALAAVLALGVPHLLSSVRGMFSNAKDDPSITSRTDSYAVALQFFEHAPWFGRGLGTFLPKYRIFDNNYLGLLVSGGIVGVIAFTAIPVIAIVVLVRRRRRWADAQSTDLALSLVAGITAGAVSLAFFDGFGFPMTMGTLFLALGVAGALIRLHPTDLDRERHPAAAAGEPLPSRPSPPSPPSRPSRPQTTADPPEATADGPSVTTGASTPPAPRTSRA